MTNGQALFLAGAILLAAVVVVTDNSALGLLLGGVTGIVGVLAMKFPSLDNREASRLAAERK